MNVIVIKTDAGEYFPGNDVRGDVYLNIVRPTAAKGIKLDIYITEEFKYSYVSENGFLETEQSKIRHLKNENVILYERDSPLSHGSYRFPFEFTVPISTPGSFHSVHMESPEWKAVSLCVIIATAIDSTALTMSQSVVILNCTKQELDEKHVVSPQSTVYPVKSLLLWKKNRGISVTCKLLQNIYKTGENLELRLIIANNTAVNIISLKIKLIRHLKFKTLESTTRTATNFHCFVPKLDTISPVEKRGSYNDGEKLILTPEGGPHIIWEKFALMNGNISLMNNVLDKILIPLRDKNNVPFLPTLNGSAIECKYSLEIILDLNIEASITITHDIPCILPLSNKQWESIVLPEWTKNGIILSDC
ncbi:hypothetical protein LOTGIDRAFT_170409 [Lottia gigantea]|uniref:Arrestin-like N-terminal domain-containing protein n=1 Tax=Lottia gigantea TaxID=225164 RepID=V3YVJ3_LOTGI|nr:hypothetical protein LOTGIDRAFT_170409 [Lottia gigantea]ESO81998.1 hypothetical protein LOTGIDRAFT_170409 [Lottia gigantea]